MEEERVKEGQEQNAGAAVALNGVSFGYRGAEPILNDISLEIRRGEWVSLVGPNGCGKSTLVKLFNGLLAARSGDISVSGYRLADETVSAVRQEIGMVFQNPDNQFVGTTVEEDILFGLEGLRLPVEEMRRRLLFYSRKLNLEELLGKHPGELSGGQKQRVAIASILAMEPGIVVFDEASSMLDERSRQELLDIMRSMHAEGRYTLIAITHDAEEIAASGRVLAIEGGSVAADLTPAELFADGALLARCHLKPPFAWQLARELERKGLGSGAPECEKELTDRLWPSN